MATFVYLLLLYSVVATLKIITLKNKEVTDEIYYNEYEKICYNGNQKSFA